MVNILDHIETYARAMAFIAYRTPPNERKLKERKKIKEKYMEEKCMHVEDDVGLLSFLKEMELEGIIKKEKRKWGTRFQHRQDRPYS